MGSRIKTVIFPVAGLGTRFLPATKAISKEMLPVVDKPLIEYAVAEAKAAGIEKFIFVVPEISDNSLVIRHFSQNPSLEALLEARNKPVELNAIRENTLAPDSMFFAVQDKPLGLGHAVLCAEAYVEESEFAVILADDLILAQRQCMHQMVDAHNQSGGVVLAIEEVAPQFVNRYGIVTPRKIEEKIVEVAAIVEKPEPAAAPSNLAAIGRYILNHEVFDVLRTQKTGFGGEIQLTDAINTLALQRSVHGLIFQGIRYDCGNKAGYVAANIAYAFAEAQLKEQVKKLLGELD